LLELIFTIMFNVSMFFEQDTTDVADL